MSDLTWMLKIVDGVSTPADHAARALKNVGSVMTSTDAGLKNIAGAMKDTANNAKALSDVLNKIKAPSLDGVNKALLGIADQAARDKMKADAPAIVAQAQNLHRIQSDIARVFASAQATQQKRDDLLLNNLVKSKIDRLIAADKRTMELLSTGMQQKAGFSEWWAKSSSKGVGPGPSVFSKLIGGASKLSPGFGAILLGGAKVLADWDEKLRSVGLSLGGVVCGGAMAAAAAIAAVGIAVGTLIFKVAELGVKAAVAFSKFAVSTLSFRENTLIAFETILRSKDAAADLYDAATEFAAATPFNTDQIVGAYQKLLVAGFKKDELATMMKAVGDVAAMKGFKPEVMDQMITGFAKLRGMGKLTGEVLEMEAFQGIRGNIIKQLAEAKGKTADEIQAMISAGKIDAASAEKAILDVIKNTYSGGKLGGAMEKFSSTWTGLWSTLGSRGSDLFNAAAKDVEGGLAKYFASIKEFVDWLGKALDPKSESGQRIVVVINQIGHALNVVAAVMRGFLGGLFDGFVGGMSKSSDATRELSQSDLEKLAKDARDVGLAFGKIAGAVGEISKAMPSLEAINKALFALKIIGIGVLVVFSLVALAAATFFAPLLIIAAIIVGAIGLAVYGLIKLGQWIGEWASDAIGSVEGAIDGITDAVASFSILDEATAAVRAAADAVKSFLASFSLASEGASIGRSLIDGLVAGITGGVSAAAGAASGAASAVIAAASGPKGFDAHSPSKKLEELGGFASEGLAKGITRKAPLATSAVADMVSPPSPGSTTAQWAQAGQSGGGARSVTISEGAIVINAPTGDGDDIRRALVSAFETISIQLNGAPA